MSSTQRGQVREQVADPLAALAVLLELPLRPDDAALVLVAAAAEGLHRGSSCRPAVQLRLVVEGVDVARAAVHEQEDDALGLGGEVRLLRGQRVDERRRAVGGDGLAGEEAVARQQRRSERSAVKPPPASQRNSRRVRPQKLSRRVSVMDGWLQRDVVRMPMVHGTDRCRERFIGMLHMLVNPDTRTRSGSAPAGSSAAARLRRRGLLRSHATSMNATSASISSALGRRGRVVRRSASGTWAAGVVAGALLRSRSAKRVRPARCRNSLLSIASACVGCVVQSGPGSSRRCRQRRSSPGSAQQRPLDVDVDAPPRGLLGRRLAPAVARASTGRPALPAGSSGRCSGRHIFGFKLPLDGQDRIADLLGRQPPHVEPPEQVVVGVFGQRRHRSRDDMR